MASIVPPVTLDNEVTAERMEAREPIRIQIGDTTVLMSEAEAKDLAARLAALVEEEETKV